MLAKNKVEVCLQTVEIIRNKSIAEGKSNKSDVFLENIEWVVLKLCKFITYNINLLPQNEFRESFTKDVFSLLVTRCIHHIFQKLIFFKLAELYYHMNHQCKASNLFHNLTLLKFKLVTF